MHLTLKQLELMRVICKKNEDGSWLDVDQIVERTAYKPTKQSLQFSIRALIKHGLIEKLAQENRRNRQRTIIGPTEAGLKIMGKGGSFVSEIVEDGDGNDIVEMVWE